MAPAPPPAVTSSFAEVVAPPERAALSFIPCAVPRPPEAAAAVAPAKVPPRKKPAVAGSDVHVTNVEDVDPVDNLVAASGLYNHRVAAELNTFALAMEEPRGYIGIAMFVIFALRYRVRVFLWFGDTCEDALLQYAPWANDAVSAVAKCHAVSCKFQDDGSVRGLDDEAFRTNHWVAGFPLDGGGAPGGASLADSMCEETRFLYAQYLSHSVQLAATVTDGDCGVDVMCSMLGWNRSSVNRDALRSELCAYILKHAGNRAFVAMLRHTGEIDNHLGLYELDVAGAALVAARPPEHRHGDGGAQGALCEGPKHAERHYSEEEVLALRRKCGLRTAGREMVVRMLKRLPDECVKALVREYTTRGDGEEKTQRKPAATFLLDRDAPLVKKRKAAEYFLAWMEEHQGPLDEKTTRELQRGRFRQGLFKAFVTEHPALARATAVAAPLGKTMLPGKKKNSAGCAGHEYRKILRIYQRAVRQFLTSAVAEPAVDSTVALYKGQGNRCRRLLGGHLRKGTDPTVRDYKRRRNFGAGRHRACGSLREQLAEWYSIMRHSVDVKVMCRFPKKVLLTKAIQLQEEYYVAHLKQGKTLQTVQLNGKWLAGFMREYRIVSRRPNRKFKVPRVVLAERLSLFWVIVSRLRKMIMLHHGYDPEMRNVDQSPFHMNEAGSCEWNTLTLQNAVTVPLIENHAATRERWSLNSVTDSCRERVMREVPGCELMFKAEGKKLEGKLKAFAESRRLPFKFSVVTGPSGSYREHDILNHLAPPCAAVGPPFCPPPSCLLPPPSNQPTSLLSSPPPCPPPH